VFEVLAGPLEERDDPGERGDRDRLRRRRLGPPDPGDELDDPEPLLVRQLAPLGIGEQVAGKMLVARREPRRERVGQVLEPGVAAREEIGHRAHPWYER